MQNTNQHQNSQTLMPELQECWWMQAGVVPYKLCDRDYDCDHCPFDEALQGKTAKSRWLSESTTLAPVDQDACKPTINSDSIQCKVAHSLFYHPAHVWARIEEGGAVRTGIDDFGQFLLGKAYSAVLPAPGDEVRQGEDCWRFTHQAGVLRLVAPVSGRVKEVNTSLALRPTLINRDPYGAGWAFLIEPYDLKQCLKRLLYGHNVTNWQNRQVEILSQAARELYSDEPLTVGVTMPDGGALSDRFLNNTTREQRRRLIAAIFPQSSAAEVENNNAILLQWGR